MIVFNINYSGDNSKPIFSNVKVGFDAKNKGKSAMIANLPFRVEGTGEMSNLLDDLQAVVASRELVDK